VPVGEIGAHGWGGGGRRQVAPGYYGPTGVGRSEGIV
jgi:hypothetical protein